MRSVSLFKCVCLLAVLATSWYVPHSASAQETPMDLILAVDVSYSMTWNSTWEDTTNKKPADPEGKRWDGLQFLVDTAGEDDRIAIILFQHKTDIATLKLDGEGGFVPVRGEGRKKLKSLIARLKEIELQSQEDYQKGKIKVLKKYDNLPGKEGPFEIELDWIKGGTSNFNALKLAATELVPKMRRQVDQRLILFTDGADSDIKTPDEIKSETDPEKKKLAIEERNNYLKKSQQLAREIGNQKIPLFVFGLGDDCDDELLKIFAMESRPKDSAVAQNIGYSEYFKVNTNVELFVKLREVGWELRQRWPIPLEKTPISGGIQLMTPNLSPFSDFGVLLFTQKQKSAIAPDMVLVDESLGADELTSTSHTYLRLPSGKDTVGKITVKAQGEIEQYAAAGTTKPLFTFQSPKLEYAYSPLEVVPIVVAFNSDVGKGFEPSQFEVAVEIIKADGTNPFAVPSPTTPIRFELTLSNDGSGLFQHFWVPHRSWNVETPNFSTLKGRWDIRVFLSAKSGPLKGAKRALFLKQFELTDYPKLEIGTEKLEVSNVSQNPKPGWIQPVVRFTPPLRNPPKGVLLSLTQMIQSDRNDLKLPAKERVDLVVSPSGELSLPLLDLTKIEWSKLKAGENVTATISYTVPWQKEPVNSTLSILKKRYPIALESGQLKFDAGDPKLSGTALARLETELVTEETYFLSGDSDSSTRGFEVKLQQVNGKKDKTAKVKILGGAGTLFGGPDRQQARVTIEVSLENAAEQVADAEVFRGNLYLHGPSLVTERIPIEIVREAVQIQVRVRGDEWVPVTMLRFPALAGTTVEKEFRFSLRVNMKADLEVSGKFAPGALELQSNEAGERGGKIPTWGPESTNAKTRRWRLQIPPSVVEGIYGNELKFEVQSEGKTYKCSLPTEVQVSHYAIKAVDQEGKPLLKPDGGNLNLVRLPVELGGRVGLFDFSLVSDSRSPDYRIGWDCEVLPSKGALPSEWLKRIKVIDTNTGQSVLRPFARTVPLWHDAEKNIRPRRGLRVEFPTENLPPGLYSFVVRVNSRLEILNKAEPKDAPPPKLDDPTSATSAPYEIPFEILVPGREIIGLKTELKEFPLGSKTTVEVKIKSYGLPAGIGSVIAIDEPKQPQIPLKQIDKTNLSADETDYTFKGEFSPQRGGISRLQLTWPKQDPTLPALDLLTRETSLEVGGVVIVEPTMVFPGEMVKIRLQLTEETVKSLNGQVLLQVRRIGTNDPPIDVLLQDDGKPDSGDEKASDGEYTGKFRCPGTKGDTAFLGKYIIDWPTNRPPTIPLRSTTSTDPTAKGIKPPSFYIGLERSGEELLGLINYDTGVFGWLPSVQTTLTQDNVFNLRNYGPSPCRYRVTILYPKQVTDSRNILNREPLSLDQEKMLVSFDPKLHLYIVPFLGKAASGDLPVLEGELARDEELKIGLTAKLSEDANIAWREKIPHESLSGVNGAVIKVELSWETPDGEKWSRVAYHRVQLSTESFWKTQGLAYLLCVIGILGIGGLCTYWYVRRRIKRKKLAQNTPSVVVYDDPLLANQPPTNLSQNNSDKTSNPSLSPPSINFDDVF